MNLILEPEVLASLADCDWARLHPYGYNHVSEVPGKRRAQR